jgi:hypothetical protein
MMKDTFDNYTPEKNIYILQDLSNPNQSITPYISNKTNEIYDYVPHHKQVYIASVFPNTVTFRLAAFIVKARRRSHPHVRVPMYTNLESALMWLREIMKQDEDRS